MTPRFFFPREHQGAVLLWLEAREMPQQVTVALGVHIFTIHCLWNRFHTPNAADDLLGGSTSTVPMAAHGGIPSRLPPTCPETLLAHMRDCSVLVQSNEG